MDRGASLEFVVKIKFPALPITKSCSSSSYGVALTTELLRLNVLEQKQQVYLGSKNKRTYHKTFGKPLSMVPKSCTRDKSKSKATYGSIPEDTK
jgi:hypothetical protein